MKSLIVCHNLCLGYKNKSETQVPLFPSFNISLNEGELTALVGPNGAGKTSLLKTITGNLKPLSGQLFILGQNLTDFHADELAKIISIVLTDRILDQNINVFDVVAMGRYPYTGFWATLNKYDKSVVNQSMEMVGIESFAERTFATLSDGERQKVMIAKALAQDTPIILLDEPAAFLDYPSKIELMHLMQKLVNQHHKTILYSSHDLDLVLRSADRLWLVASGKPIVSDIPEQLVLDGFIEKYFTRAGLHFNFEKGQFTQPISGDKKICVISHGITGIWLCRALERKGWSVSQNMNEDIVVQYVNREFIVTKKNIEMRFSELETLIQELCIDENTL